MLKYYKEILSQYEYASVLQTVTLLAFIVVFVGIFIKVMNKPKDYYKEEGLAALDLDSEESEKKIIE